MLSAGIARTSHFVVTKFGLGTASLVWSADQTQLRRSIPDASQAVGSLRAHKTYRLILCSRLESNQHHFLRREISYPLNDESGLCPLYENYCVVLCSWQDFETYSFSTPIGFSIHSEILENTQSGFDSCTKAPPCFFWARKLLRSFVLLAGIEPAFLPSQGSVLSIERQGHYHF